jgi:hypothetical protein
LNRSDVATLSLTAKMETNNNWYYLDPDHNKTAPNKPHCARCKRPIKDTQSFEHFKSIELHPDKDTPWFRLNPLGRHLIGAECFHKVIEEYGMMTDGETP